jgi:hypothetical protein
MGKTFEARDSLARFKADAWRDIQTSDSVHVAFSKTYLRFYERQEDGSYKSPFKDMASI